MGFTHHFKEILGLSSEQISNIDDAEYNQHRGYSGILLTKGLYILDLEGKLLRSWPKLKLLL